MTDGEWIFAGLCLRGECPWANVGESCVIVK